MLLRESASFCFAISVCKSAAFARELYKNPLKTGMFTLTPTAPYQFGMFGSRTGADPDHSERVHARPPQIVLGGVILLRRFNLKLQRLQFRPLLQRLHDQRRDFGSRRLHRFIRALQIEVLLVLIPENRRERGQRRLKIVLRLEQQQFRPRHIDLREAQIEVGPQLGVGKRLDLIDERLPSVIGLLSNGHQIQRLQ